MAAAFLPVDLMSIMNMACAAPASATNFVLAVVVLLLVAKPWMTTRSLYGGPDWRPPRAPLRRRRVYYVNDHGDVLSDGGDSGDDDDHRDDGADSNSDSHSEGGPGGGPHAHDEDEVPPLLMARWAQDPDLCPHFEITRRGSNAYVSRARCMNCMHVLWSDRR
jgi:hypothetical protein